MSSAPTDPDLDARPEEQEPEEDSSELRSAAVDVGQHGERLDKMLTGLAPEFSRAHLQTLIADGHVQLDGRPVTTSSTRLKAGQKVVVELVPPPQDMAFKGEDVPLDIVHEDEHVLVINKPAGLVVHPAAGNWSGTLLNGLLWRDPKAAGLPRAGIVHRLDKDTSGLMVVGRTLPAVNALVRDIAARVVSRQYLALAHGRLKHLEESIIAPVGRDPKTRVRMAVIQTGKPARTDVREIGYAQSIAALRCTLHSGRTHQIRVHLMFRGHPLVSDEMYGGRRALGMERQALHATHLAFKHPITGEPLAFDCAPPQDFAQAWAQILGAAREDDFGDDDDEDVDPDGENWEYVR